MGGEALIIERVLLVVLVVLVLVLLLAESAERATRRINSELFSFVSFLLHCIFASTIRHFDTCPSIRCCNQRQAHIH